MVSARSNLVGRLGVFSGTRARDFTVGFRAAVAEELPGIADFLDFIEIEFGDEQFVLVAAGLLDDFPTRIAEITLAVKFADFPGSFRANAVDSGDEILIGDGVGGLLEFPKIFGEAGNGSGRVINDFGAVEAKTTRAFREVAVVTYVYADAGVARLENGVAGVSGREIKFFPEARMAMRDVVLAVFAEVAAIGVDDRGGVVVDAGHFDFVDRGDEHHLVLFGELLHGRDGGTAVNFLLGGIGDQALVFGDHLLLDVRERIFLRRPLTLRLNQATADVTGHATPPEQRQAKSLLSARGWDKVSTAGFALSRRQQINGMNAGDCCRIDGQDGGHYHRVSAISCKEPGDGKRRKESSHNFVGCLLVVAFRRGRGPKRACDQEYEEPARNGGVSSIVHR